MIVATGTTNNKRTTNYRLNFANSLEFTQRDNKHEIATALDTQKSAERSPRIEHFAQRELS
jgi:hypothetical protein